MESEFWNERWKQGRIGFHEMHVNGHLARNIQRFEGRKRVLVPLCGKAEDLHFLAKSGLQVVGVEWIELAVQQYFSERALTPTRQVVDGLVKYQHDNVTLWAGDFFAATSNVLGRCDAFYDRAALVALKPEKRRAYVAHLKTLLSPKAVGLLVTLETHAEDTAGPPFSVSEAEVRGLFQGDSVELVDTVKATGGRFETAGIEATEKGFWVACG
jgi:thiopurine S-methyltransferase